MMKIKSQQEILTKLGIEELNEMQKEAQLAIHSTNQVVLLSPTGTGKTLAFLLPTLSEMNLKSEHVQTMIIAPSRELAIQIEQVAREMGTGHKINIVYGGRHFSKDRQELQTAPGMIIGTPGRLADHLRRHSFDTQDIKTLILDEFDKSLEVGFEDEMSEILDLLPALEKIILTSATKGINMPKWLGLEQPVTIDYLGSKTSKLRIRSIISPSKDKLETLGNAICHLGDVPGIIFCNYKDSINRVSNHLDDLGINHGCFYGGMEQKERERALIKFRNGTHRLLLATDLAARGIDVPEIKFIIHYHLPHRAEEFTHRNGRTARMHKEGTAYILHWENEDLPEFIYTDRQEYLVEKPVPTTSTWKTVFVSGGRKDKISKGDIAGMFFKQGDLKKEQLGIIELKHDCAFIAVDHSSINTLISKLDNTRLKKRKVRVKVI